MSAASELREAIQDSVVLFGNNVMHVKPELLTEARNRSVDAILDAVIAALPEEGDEGEPGSFNVGYNWALNDAKAILQSAKTQKGTE